GDRPPALRDQQDPRSEIPFIFRLDREGRLHPSRRNQRQSMGDGIHGPALDLAVETDPAAASKLPWIDHDLCNRIGWSGRRDPLAVQIETPAAAGREEFVGRGIKNRGQDGWTLLDQPDWNAKLRSPIDVGLGAVDRIHYPHPLPVEP